MSVPGKLGQQMRFDLHKLTTRIIKIMFSSRVLCYSLHLPYALPLCIQDHIYTLFLRLRAKYDAF